jgi:hypothetical protein
MLTRRRLPISILSSMQHCAAAAAGGRPFQADRVGTPTQPRAGAQGACHEQVNAEGYRTALLRWLVNRVAERLAMTVPSSCSMPTMGVQPPGVGNNRRSHGAAAAGDTILGMS